MDASSSNVTMTGIYALILVIVLGLIGATEIQAAAESPPVKNGLIALTLRDSAGRLQIFTIHADGTGKQQLTFQEDNGRPDWSPGGKRIAFAAHRGDKEFVPGSSHKMFVGVMDADGSKVKLLTEGNALIGRPTANRSPLAEAGRYG
ncbi:MAG: hypothetical protein HQ567_18480 [Candidatus Nealsonbacteria bacterium]|nr:hypothetical protein [Candidatus Nealsonbacteria bacterium]